MKKFWRFNDPEYETLFNLLDNYIPLALSIYSIFQVSFSAGVLFTGEIICKKKHGLRHTHYE